MATISPSYGIVEPYRAVRQVEAGRGGAEAQLDAEGSQVVRCAQRQPVRLPVAGQHLLGQRGPVVGGVRFVADEDERAVVALTTERLDRRQTDGRGADGVLWLLLPLAAGSRTRLHRAYVEAVQAHAAHAELTREEEARLRVTEGRMRIARELHDVVAHHIALANAQAATAARLAPTSPEQTQKLLADLTDTTSSALRELKATVGLLRQANDPESAPWNRPPGSTASPNSSQRADPPGSTSPSPPKGSDGRCHREWT